MKLFLWLWGIALLSGLVSCIKFLPFSTREMGLIIMIFFFFAGLYVGLIETLIGI